MKQSAPVLPGSRKLGCDNTGRSERPHILLCAPSNAAVDELAKRLLKEGLVVDSAQWKAKNNRGKQFLKLECSCLYEACSVKRAQWLGLSVKGEWLGEQHNLPSYVFLTLGWPFS